MKTRILIDQDILAFLDMLEPSVIHEKYTFIDYMKIRLKYPVFKFVLCMRVCYMLEQIPILKIFYWLEKLKFRRLQIKFGIQTGHRLNPKGGFFIGHFGGIVIHEGTKIGKNLILHQNTSIGTTDRGVPLIGNNVTIGANVCIIGNVTIGDNCTIGAGSIVTKSFEKNSIIAGNPARLIGMKCDGEHKF